MSMLAEARHKTKYVLNPRKAPLWSQDSSSSGLKLGKDLMEKMGWTPGKGLGSKEQGIVEPLRVSFKSDNKGMGFKGDENDWTEQQEEFDLLLSTLTNGKGDDPDSAEKKNVKSLEEKSRLSRARVHYKKFTRGKDMSLYSEHDLACILGTKKEKKVKEKKVEEVEQPPEIEGCETSFGVTTINSGSINDYFKKKWTNLKTKSTSEAGKQENDKESVEVDQNQMHAPMNGVGGLNFDKNGDLVLDNGSNKKKKKKKDKNHEDEANNGSGEETKEKKNSDVECNEIEAEGLKKKKKEKRQKALGSESNHKTEDYPEKECKKESEEGTDSKTLIEVCGEEAKPKKKRKEKVEIEKISNENGSANVYNEETTVFLEEKTKKKKKKHQSDVDAVGNENEIRADDCSIEIKSAKKKKRKADDTETEINTDLINSSNATQEESAKKEKKKSKKKDENETEEIENRKEIPEADESTKKKKNDKNQIDSILDDHFEADKSEEANGMSKKMRKHEKQQKGKDEIKVEENAEVTQNKQKQLENTVNAIEGENSKKKKKGKSKNDLAELKDQNSNVVDCLDKAEPEKPKKKGKHKQNNLEPNFEDSAEADSKKKKETEVESDFDRKSISDKLKHNSNLIEESEKSGSSKKQKKKDKHQKGTEEDKESDINYKIAMGSKKCTEESKKRKKDYENIEKEDSDMLGTSKKQKKKDKHKKADKEDIEAETKDRIEIVGENCEVVSRKKIKDDENLEKEGSEMLGTSKKKGKHKKGNEEEKKSDDRTAIISTNCSEESGKRKVDDENLDKEAIEMLGTSKKQKKKDKRKMVNGDKIGIPDYSKDIGDEGNLEKEESSMSESSMQQKKKEKHKKVDKEDIEAETKDKIHIDENCIEISRKRKIDKEESKMIEASKKQKKKDKHKKDTEDVELEPKGKAEDLDENSIEESGKRKRKKDKLKDSEINLESNSVEASTEPSEKKRKESEISSENVSKSRSIDEGTKIEDKAVIDQNPNKPKKLKNVVHSHKSEFFKNSPSILPENYSNARVLSLVCGTDFEKFRGSNLTNFIGYGAKNENGKIYNMR